MANNLIQVKNIKGLTPALEPKNLEQPFAISGKNFAVDYEGPYAAFANIFTTYDTLDSADGVDTFDCNGESITCCPVGMFSYDPISGFIVPRFVLPTALVSFYPWSFAEINGIFYFCARTADVIFYDPSQNAWGLLRNIGQADTYMPAVPVSVCKSYGRLHIVGLDKDVWSAQDDGTNLAIDLTSGAASQAISLIGGEVQKIVEVFDGVIIFTTNGLLKGEITDLPTIYRWYILTKVNKAINPFLIIETSQQNYIFLDKQGFMTTNGYQPKEFAPLFSEFLSQKLLPSLRNLNKPSLLRLFYNEDFKFLCLSLANPQMPTLYYVSYVLYLSNEEWGVYNETHYGLGLYNYANAGGAGYDFGVVDDRGNIKSFVPYDYKELSVDLGNNVFWQPLNDFPTSYENGILIAAGNIRFFEFDFSLWSALGVGLYAVTYTNNDPTLPVIKMGNKNYGDLQAEVTVGLFRLNDKQYSDELSDITNLSVGMYDNGIFGDQVDYLLVEPDVFIDYMTVEPDQFYDWGFGVLSSLVYNVELISTNDGITQLAFSPTIPTLAYDAGGVEYYSLNAAAVFHALRFYTNDKNQSFHLRFLELSGFLAGRV